MESKSLVVGIDLGSSDSYIGYIGKGIVDIAQNEASSRKTPTLVGFTDRERTIGESAGSLIKSNTKNTCRNFKHLLGQALETPSVQDEAFWSTCPLVQADDGMAGYSVNYKGEPQEFSAVAVTAMFLTKLKETAESWAEGKVADVVIGVPSYFSDVHRRALLDASDIAGLNVLRLMNEHTAVALAYGIYRTNDFDPEKPMTVAFCCMGHCVFSVAIVQFVRGRLTVLAERADKVGGRDMDACLMRTFAKEFEAKHRCNPLDSKKPAFKLEDAVAKTKKILSANSEANISVECLMEDLDFSSRLTRDEFLEMCKPMMKRAEAVLEEAKAAFGGPVSAIDTVELCGGASRVPWVKEMCSKAFGGKDLSTTLNADEAVARGCTLQAAILSPLYKVRDFKIEDTSAFPVSLSWTAQGLPQAGATVDGGDVAMAPVDTKTAVVFQRKSFMNIVKMVTFFRKEPFDLKAHYTDTKALLPGTSRELGTYRVEVPARQQAGRVKVKVALSLHGTFSVESATLLVEEGDEEAGRGDIGSGGVGGGAATTNGTAPKADGDDANHKDDAVDGAAAKDAAPMRPKKRYKRTAIVVTPNGVPGLSTVDLNKRKAEEEAMQIEMAEIDETNTRRNDLEAYILDMRRHIAEDGKYGPFVPSDQREVLGSALTTAEDWLWDHMEEDKQVFIDKLAELRATGDPVETRFREDSLRPELIATLQETVASSRATSSKLRSGSLGGGDAARAQELEEACIDADRWLNRLLAQQAQLPKHADPVLECAALEQRAEELHKLADDIGSASHLPGAGASGTGGEEEPDLSLGPGPVDVD